MKIVIKVLVAYFTAWVSLGLVLGGLGAGWECLVAVGLVMLVGSTFAGVFWLLGGFRDLA